MIIEPNDPFSTKPEMEKLRNIATSVVEVVNTKPEEKPEPISPQDLYANTISNMKPDGPFFQGVAKK